MHRCGFCRTRARRGFENRAKRAKKAGRIFELPTSLGRTLKFQQRDAEVVVKVDLLDLDARRLLLRAAS